MPQHLLGKGDPKAVKAKDPKRKPSYGSLMRMETASIWTHLTYVHESMTHNGWAIAWRQERGITKGGGNSKGKGKGKSKGAAGTWKGKGKGDGNYRSQTQDNYALSLALNQQQRSQCTEEEKARIACPYMACRGRCKYGASCVWPLDE